MDSTHGLIWPRLECIHPPNGNSPAVSKLVTGVVAPEGRGFDDDTTHCRGSSSPSPRKSRHPGHILVTMVADRSSGDPAETFLGGLTMTAIDDVSREDDGFRHGRVRASAIDLTTI
jgi:hypothetical protein